MTVGYIIQANGAMKLHGGLLYFSNTATLFETRRRAQKAVAATIDLHSRKSLAYCGLCVWNKTVNQGETK